MSLGKTQCLNLSEQRHAFYGPRLSSYPAPAPPVEQDSQDSRSDPDPCFLVRWLPCKEKNANQSRPQNIIGRLPSRRNQNRRQQKAK